MYSKSLLLFLYNLVYIYIYIPTLKILRTVYIFPNGPGRFRKLLTLASVAEIAMFWAVSGSLGPGNNIRYGIVF